MPHGLKVTLHGIHAVGRQSLPDCRAQLRFDFGLNGLFQLKCCRMVGSFLYIMGFSQRRIYIML